MSIQALSQEEPPFITLTISEYIDCISLRDFLESLQRSLPRLVQSDAVYLTKQILKGLEYAHGHGVIHCGLNPRNNMIQPNGDVKLEGFIISAILGTAAQGKYAAPEITEKGSADERSDIYSAGAVLYEMLTGEAPQAGNKTIVFPEMPGADITQGMKEIVLRAMDFDPEKRYQSAEEMLNDINIISKDSKRTFGCRNIAGSYLSLALKTESVIDPSEYKSYHSYDTDLSKKALLKLINETLDDIELIINKYNSLIDEKYEKNKMSSHKKRLVTFYPIDREQS